jgi:1,4-dihydroxy-2-naphthoate octaprenyltransferase
MEKQMSQAEAWLLATRPKTLTAALVPVCTATALAHRHGVEISWLISLFSLLTAIFIQIGTNLFNDALDFQKGADTHLRLGPRRVTQSGLIPFKQVLVGGVCSFALALLCGIPLVLQGGWPITLLLLISVSLGYLYTGGAFPISYQGLGEPFVFFFFGLISTLAVYYLQSGGFSWSALLAGAQIGALATVLIAINNLRDWEGDRKAHKRTLAVRFGPFFARREITGLVMLAFLLNIGWVFLGNMAAALLPFSLTPVAVRLVRYIWQYEPGEVYNQFLGLAAFIHLAFGLLLSVGFWMK